MVCRRDARELGPVALARLRALLPQHSTLDFDFTVDEVVAMGRAPWQPESMVVQQGIAAAALRLVGIEVVPGTTCWWWDSELVFGGIRPG
ncbi:MAG: hypothetical protein U5K74_00905 [Gemmatimonadaceae bacterium]|nr:hypothetical protein [Gemmatimonadaceae bacterium]